VRFLWIMLTAFCSTGLASAGISRPVNDQRAVVRVIHGESNGSGFVVGQAKGVALVLTSNHVLNSGQKIICVQFGQLGFEARVVNLKIHGKDMALLYVPIPKGRSINELDIALKATRVGDEITALGYDRKGDFLRRSGTVKLTLTKPLEDGYDLGTTADLEKGMSGGPMINKLGKVVAVNSTHSEPLWEQDLFYEGGGEVDADLNLAIAKMSMGVWIASPARLIIDTARGHIKKPLLPNAKLPKQCRRAK